MGIKGFWSNVRKAGAVEDGFWLEDLVGTIPTGKKCYVDLQSCFFWKILSAFASYELTQSDSKIYDFAGWIKALFGETDRIRARFP